jgi:hypothetical protein
MNFIGKIFVVMIMIMTFLFCAGTVMVFVTHKNWQEAALAAAARLESAKISNANLLREKEEALNQLAKERAERRLQIADLTSKLSNEQGLKNTLAQDNARLNTQLAEALNQSQLINQASEYLTTENSKLLIAKVGAEEAHDRRLTELVEKTDQLASEQGNSSRLSGENLELAELSATQRMVLNMHGLTLNSISDEPPALDGVVTAVSATTPLVQISLGSDDGLKRGHALEVFRGTSYLGRIVIRELEPNRAVGMIVKELQKDLFQRGDRVATKL